MRLGGPVFGDCSTPDLWIAALQRKRYRAAICPLKPDASDDEIHAIIKAARDADILIAEVGAWSNPMSSDEAERQAALEKCKTSLALADRVGATVCINIAGSRGQKWDGPHPDNLTEETFEMIVATTRDIIDSVQPTRTFYALESMPWIFPDSPDSYLRLIHAIDRAQFGVHLDPVNIINCPSRFFDNAGFLRECFAKLGPYIKSCHAKDIALSSQLTVHLDEKRPGLGSLDYRVFLTELNKLDADIPILVEHLPNEEEYDLASNYIRSVAEELGTAL
jgi:sugar phosphate isomerase/epimerase